MRAVIAITNAKGATSETKTCASLAVLLLELGEKPVLMVDCDPRGALPKSFAVAPKPGEKTVHHALLERGITIRDAVQPVREGLDDVEETVVRLKYYGLRREDTYR